MKQDKLTDEQQISKQASPDLSTQIEEIVHSLAEEIADTFGGDIDAHPQEALEIQARTQILALVKATHKEADRKTLETVWAILNGDERQVEIAKTYIWNKLKVLYGDDNE